MTPAADPDPRTTVAELHRLLIRLGGPAPDDLLYAARSWLAAGWTVEVAQAVAYAAGTGQVPLTGAHVAALAAALAGSGMAAPDPASTPEKVWGFAPFGPAVLAQRGAAPVHPLDLTGHPHGVAVGEAGRGTGGPWPRRGGVLRGTSRNGRTVAAGPENGHGGTATAGDPAAADDAARARDGLDAVAVDAAASWPGPTEAAPRGLWRVWRYPHPPTPWPAPKRLYPVLARADDPALLPALTDHVQRALVAAGEPDPRVEVFSGEPPPFLRAALGYAALLWADRPGPPPRLLSLFDTDAERHARAFAPDRAPIGAAEKAALAAYLAGSAPVLTAAATVDDVVDRTRGPLPMAFRTDGTFIWPEAVSHHLEHDGVAPAALIEHARHLGHRPPEVDAVTLHRAVCALNRLANHRPAAIG